MWSPVGWNVVGLKLPGTYTLTATVTCCATVRVTGSLQVSAPAASVHAGLTAEREGPVGATP